ncbi:MAG: esterase [Burkholderiales bacterium]|nr:esterase [Burkholderiales bacterium]
MKSTVFRVARVGLCAGVLAAVALLASCGGGAQSQTFAASRVIAFGDESSVITADQKKYSVNALLTGSTTAVDCTGNPLWIQTVAARYGLVFQECPGTVPAPVSHIYAANGAMVADLSAQIDQQLLNGGFKAGDLVTVLVGANDVLAQFAQYPGVGEAQISANLDAAGRALAAQVNRLAALGAKVLISTIPDMGLTPFAGDRSVGSTNGNPALLSRLSEAFNIAMLAHLTNDGHQIGLVQLDQYLQASDAATRLGAGTYANTTLAACTVALPQCTTATLVTATTTSNYLWADDRHLGASGQASLGSLAVTVASNNPF